jgi:SagB-type dehydrogenase family enzyme
MIPSDDSPDAGSADDRETNEAPGDGETPGRRFQRTTEYRRETLPSRGLACASKPPAHKLYPNAPVVVLPRPETENGASLWAAAAGRRSVRRYDEMPIALAELSRLLWASQGASGTHGAQIVRAAPSAGALYPIETYVAVRAVDDLAPGLYHYRVGGANEDGRPDAATGHALEQLDNSSVGRTLADACLQQRWMEQAAVVFIWTAVFGRCEWKYGNRAFRYIYLDAGHIAAHVSLAAVALGLGSCQVGAFFDDEVNRLIGVNGENESAVYLTTVGHVLKSVRGQESLR